MTRSAPIALALVLQACLLFCALDLLPIWTDELFTQQTVAHPVSEIIPIVQRDIHPPLYYILLHSWGDLPLPCTGIVRLRAFSALWALLATLLLDLLWTRFWTPWPRCLALGLFTLSPCLLLYGRMARSYAMQVAVAIVAVAMLQRWMKQPRSLPLAVASFAAVLALLYTHYVPGMAVLAGFVAIGWRTLGPRVAAFGLAVAAGYSPWLFTLSDAIHRWSDAAGFSSTYTLTGNPFLEQLLKLAFGLVSLTIGESFLPLSLLLVPVILVLACRGARRELGRDLAILLAIAAIVGYLGVARWVSYPFIPARLLWLLPFLALSVALALAHIRRPLLQGGIALAILLSYLSSATLYFRRENFLNLGYAAPLLEIADALNHHAQPADLILIDSFNTDFSALHSYLTVKSRIIDINPAAAAEARKRLAAAPTVWIVRNTRDISPGALTPHLWHESCVGRKEQDTFYEPFAAWQTLAMQLAGIQPVPTHFYQLTSCRAEKPQTNSF